MEGILYFTLTCVSSLLYTCYNQIKHDDKPDDDNNTTHANNKHINNTNEVSHYTGIFTHIKETITNISTIIVSSFYSSDSTNINNKPASPDTIPTTTATVVNNTLITNEFRTKFDALYIENIINKLQLHIQKDEGNRGIIKCAQNSHINQYKELFLATSNLLSSPDLKRVIILTGFPCNMEYNPPTETDGILGALAVAR